MRADGGQATVEWAGLVLLVLLVLVALGALSGLLPARDRGVGEVVAERLRCAAGSACGGPPVARAVAAPPVARAVAAPPVARAVAAPPAVQPIVGVAPRGARRARVIDALRRLRSAGTKLVRRAWIVCIGYRRFRYELEHPRAPNEMMPLDEAIDIANGCLNPYAFLVEDG
jgi:hypothetical protein